MMVWFGMTVFIAIQVIVAFFALIGLFTLYVGLRFRKSAGSKLDLTAFWFNWLAFMWMWAERVVEIIEAMPFFKQDLSETLGVKPDDGRIT